MANMTINEFNSAAAFHASCEKIVRSVAPGTNPNDVLSEKLGMDISSIQASNREAWLHVHLMRHKIVKQLKSDGYSPTAIAWIMNINESSVEYEDREAAE